VRDCYEAYVLYQFFSLLVSYIENSKRTKIDLDEYLMEKGEQSHPFPLCCLPNFKPGPRFFLVTKQCILQYVMVRPLMAIITVILEMFELYKEGSFSFDSGYLYITFINNFSVSLSMYFLVLFYLATREELAPHQPGAKLASIKAILLFSFWQAIIIGILSRTIPVCNITWVEKQQMATRLNDFLICMEMCALSIVHHFVFPYQTYQLNDQLYLSKEGVYNAIVRPVRNFTDVVNQQDLLSDIKHTYDPNKMKHAKRKEKNRENMKGFLSSDPNYEGDPELEIASIDDDGEDKDLDGFFPI